MTRLLCALLAITALLNAQTPVEVPYIASSPKIVEAMLKLAGVRQGDVVYDLGCGDGRIVITAAHSFHARGTGIDIDPERIREAEASARRAGVLDRVRFLKADVYSAELREASVVTLYMTADVNRTLRPRLLNELKSGSRIVSHTFDMDDWKPDRTVVVDGERLYLWIVTEQARARFGGR